MLFRSGIGIYSGAAGSTVKNDGTITSGVNSIGIYNNQGTTTINGTAVHNIDNSGVGIYAEGNKQGIAQTFGNGKIDIVNSGLIQAGASSNAIGIYANNNSTGIAADAHVNLSNGTIDLGASENAVGVFVDKGTVIDSGSTITVGKNGVALYAKDSVVTLAGTTINLFGDNSLGLYLDGTTNFTGTGNEIGRAHV